jgi:hypothetical protein
MDQKEKAGSGSLREIFSLKKLKHFFTKRNVKSHESFCFGKEVF